MGLPFMPLLFWPYPSPLPEGWSLTMTLQGTLSSLRDSTTDSNFTLYFLNVLYLTQTKMPVFASLYMKCCSFTLKQTLTYFLGLIAQTSAVDKVKRH